MDLPLEILELSLIKRGLKKRKLIKEPYLEVGCGDGLNLEQFSELGMSGVGIDVSSEAVKIVFEKHLKNVQIVRTDFLTYKDFQLRSKVIFMLNLLEHTHEDIKFIQKAAEILPQGGFLVIAVPAHSKSYGFADANAGHIRRYDATELRQKLQEAGLTVDEWLEVGFPINRTYTWFFNFLNRNKPQTPIETQIEVSGIRNKDGYYGGIFDLVAKIVFPILKIIIHVDQLFIHSHLGNNFVVFARKV